MNTIEMAPKPEVRTVTSQPPVESIQLSIPQEACVHAMMALTQCFNLPPTTTTSLKVVCKNQIVLKQPRLRNLIQCAVDYRNDCTQMKACLSSSRPNKKPPAP
ncbi:hypothetical protein KKF84_07085 [Myxococcota bacterium]|nr:hypothetical protein [Myxococcota bacterium]MBU1535066.1 hypothetical protein [Myxococcota bacterium]